MNLKRHEVLMGLLLNSECFTPDSVDPDNYSAGAEFMDTVAVSLIEAIEYSRIIPNEEKCGDGEYREDVIGEIAEGSVPVSTHEMWSAFVDLGAYSSEWDEADSYGDDTMYSRATSRLVHLAEDAIHGVLAEHFDRD
mgnify:CR=1 FL=1